MRTRSEDAIRDAVINAEEAEDVGASLATTNRRLALKRQNDFGNAERLRHRYGKDLMYVPEVGRLAYTGSHWSLSGGDKFWNLAAQKVADAIIKSELPALEAVFAEEATENAAKRLHELREWGIQSGNRSRLDAMQEVAQPHRQFQVDELDADAFLFNVQNGTLELGTKCDD